MKASIAATRLTPVQQIAWRTEAVPLKARTDGEYDLEQNRRALADPQQKPEARVRAAERLACCERLQQPVLLSLLEIGPARILHLPGEPLIAYQHFACGLQPEQFLAVAGYGLGSTGYVCTERSYTEGGYEPSASALVPESERVIQAAIRRLVKAE